MMHGSSPFNNDQEDEELWQQQEASVLMGGTGDSYRSLLATDGVFTL